jgi:hypothetical protein
MAWAAEGQFANDVTAATDASANARGGRGRATASLVLGVQLRVRGSCAPAVLRQESLFNAGR